MVLVVRAAPAALATGVEMAAVVVIVATVVAIAVATGAAGAEVADNGASRRLK